LSTSIFDLRPEKGPRWPTLRGTALTPEALVRLRSVIRLMYFAEMPGANTVLPDTEPLAIGIQDAAKVHGMGKLQPCWSFEAVRHIPMVAGGNKKPLYFICWLGQYVTATQKTGTILHIGTQYPHVLKFEPRAVEIATCRLYALIAHTLYNGPALDIDVATFIEQIQQTYGL
jgi:hypothetical protein